LRQKNLVAGLEQEFEEFLRGEDHVAMISVIEHLRGGTVSTEAQKLGITECGL